MRATNLKSMLSLLLILVCAFSLHAVEKKDQKKRIKKRVAVFIFDDKTDKSLRWWNNKSVGEGVSDMLTTELVKTGNYQVIERQELDQILKEQDLGTAGIVTPQSAAEIGKVLGVELAVMGAVTEFGFKSSDTGGRVKNLGLGVKSQSATVGLDCRMVNTTTAEIITAENVRKEESSRGLRVSTPKVSFNDQKSFDESLVGKAAREAVEEVIKLIDKNAPNIPWEAKIVTVQGNKVFINAGSASGIKAGDTFVIYKKGQELIDPDTGLSLGSTDTKIGEIEVTNPKVGQGKAAQCRILSGSGFERGDFVRIE